MSDRVKQNVRYWGFLALKLIVSCAIAAVLLCEINYSWDPGMPIPEINWGLFFWDGKYTSLVGLLFLCLAGLLYLSVLDQRYRCRVCLRRLRMPIGRGSWSQMLQLGRPEVEYICIYGHGKLNVSELQISGLENPAWKEQGDIWSELFAADGEKKK